MLFFFLVDSKSYKIVHRGKNYFVVKSEFALDRSENSQLEHLLNFAIKFHFFVRQTKQFFFSVDWKRRFFSILCRQICEDLFILHRQENSNWRFLYQPKAREIFSIHCHQFSETRFILHRQENSNWNFLCPLEKSKTFEIILCRPT